MEWFGWLTKGSCHVSLLDIIILIAEIVGLSFISIIIHSFFKKGKK
jgi:hypothetical protein